MSARTAVALAWQREGKTPLIFYGLVVGVEGSYKKLKFLYILLQVDSDSVGVCWGYLNCCERFICLFQHQVCRSYFSKVSHQLLVFVGSNRHLNFSPAEFRITMRWSGFWWKKGGQTIPDHKQNPKCPACNKDLMDIYKLKLKKCYTVVSIERKQIGQVSTLMVWSSLTFSNTWQLPIPPTACIDFFIKEWSQSMDESSEEKMQSTRSTRPLLEFSPSPELCGYCKSPARQGVFAQGTVCLKVNFKNFRSRFFSAYLSMVLPYKLVLLAGSRMPVVVQTQWILQWILSVKCMDWLDWLEFFRGTGIIMKNWTRKHCWWHLYHPHLLFPKC